jgi:hypothetical protein
MGMLGQQLEDPLLGHSEGLSGLVRILNTCKDHRVPVTE